MMITIKEISNKATEYGLKIVEGGLVNDEDRKLPEIVIDPNSLDSFFGIAQSFSLTHSIMTVVKLEGEELEESLIDLEMITEVEYGPNYKQIRKNAKTFNDRLKKQAQAEPRLIRLLFHAKGMIYSIHYFADWSDVDADTELEKLAQEYASDVLVAREKQRKSREEMQEKAIMELAEDDIFKQCTNKVQRRSRARMFFREKGYCRNVDSKKNIFITNGACDDAAELAWAIVNTEKVKNKK